MGTVVFGLGGTVDPSTNGDIKGSTIRIDKGKSPTEIRFKLKDDTQRDLEFVESDPIWVGLRKDCEEEGCPSSGLSGFQLVRVSERKLTVSRADIDDEYVYMLRFIDETGKPFEYDPIIKNRL